MTRRRARLLLLSILLPLTSCTSIGHDDTDYVGATSYQLAEFSESEASTVTYELRVHPGGTAYVTIQREKPVTYQEMGLHLDELDKATAEKCKPVVRPYSGLLVREVTPGSAAERAGVKAGDVLLSVNGGEVYYLKDFNKIVDGLPANTSVAVKLRGTDAPRLIEPETRERIARTLANVPLEVPGRSNPTPYAGVRLRAIPRKYSREIYGDDRNAIVVCWVLLGSPAYLAGLRAGDIIEKVDGKPTPTLAELMKLFRDEGPDGKSVSFEVARESGEGFKAEIFLEDYSGTTRVNVPGVFHVSSNVTRTSWDILPWGMLAAYGNSYNSSKSRDPEQSGSYSMILGLFKYRWRPKGSSLRLLWFITFD